MRNLRKYSVVFFESIFQKKKRYLADPLFSGYPSFIFLYKFINFHWYITFIVIGDDKIKQRIYIILSIKNFIKCT